uniref:Era-type G domain-containing protein n=1 Tax=Caenorhabditis japonica TaxID=281687 RepID=A0A8R1DJ83_CAEJA
MIIKRLFSTASTSGILMEKSTQPATKCLQLAVIGAPNVGKSLLTNSLVRCPLSAVSSKMDTTTRNISASICEDVTQLVFVDSPGAVSTSHVRQTMKILTNGQLSDNQQIATKPAQIGRLGKSLSTTTPTNFTPTDEKWKMQFRDLIQKPTWKCSYSETRSLFREICGWSGFERVFFTSSLTGEGVDELREHLISTAPDGEWRMEEGMPTGESAQQLAMDSIRAAVLDTTPSDVAYTVNVRISEWQEQGEVLQIVGEIRCQKPRDGSLIIGKSGKRISEIGRRVNEHLHSLFQRQLYARLIVTHNGKLITQAK